MTPQERQMIDELFDRLAKLESAPRDPNAVAAIAQGLRAAPNAVYGLVQTVLVQDEALRRADSRIQELEAATAPNRIIPGGFLIRCGNRSSDRASRIVRYPMCGRPVRSPGMEQRPGAAARPTARPL